MSRCLAGRAEQAQAQKAAHLAQGTLEAETELRRREHDLADQDAALALLEAGPRPEEVEAQEARLARLLEEVRHLDGLRERLLIRSPGPGQVTTTRLREQVGHFYREGDPILVVQELHCLEAEISVAEQDSAQGPAGPARDPEGPVTAVPDADDDGRPHRGHRLSGRCAGRGHRRLPAHIPLGPATQARDERPRSDSQGILAHRGSPARTSPGVASYRGLVVGGVSADLDGFDREVADDPHHRAGRPRRGPRRPGWSR